MRWKDKIDSLLLLTLPKAIWTKKTFFFFFFFGISFSTMKFPLASYNVFKLSRISSRTLALFMFEFLFSFSKECREKKWSFQLVANESWQSDEEKLLKEIRLVFQQIWLNVCACMCFIVNIGKALKSTVTSDSCIKLNFSNSIYICHHFTHSSDQGI